MDEQPAEARSDYRFFRFLALSGARLTVAGLVFVAWYVAAYVLWGTAVTPGVFLLTTTALALIVSLVAGMVSYSLFKRRGGKIIKGEEPAPVGMPGGDPVAPTVASTPPNDDGLIK